MASELIGIEISGIDSLLETLASIDSPAVQLRVMQAVAKLLKGKLQKYPPQKYVSRAQAYGRTFQSDKQRRWFFAALRDGRLQIPYRRTNTLSNAWQVMAFKPAEVLLVNPTAYGPWVQAPDRQTRMIQLRGWQTTDEVLEASSAQAAQTAAQELQKVLKRGR